MNSRNNTTTSEGYEAPCDPATPAAARGVCIACHICEAFAGCRGNCPGRADRPCNAWQAAGDRHGGVDANGDWPESTDWGTPTRDSASGTPCTDSTDGATDRSARPTRDDQGNPDAANGVGEPQVERPRARRIPPRPPAPAVSCGASVDPQRCGDSPRGEQMSIRQVETCEPIRRGYSPAERAIAAGQRVFIDDGCGRQVPLLTP